LFVNRHNRGKAPSGQLQRETKCRRRPATVAVALAVLFCAAAVVSLGLYSLLAPAARPSTPTFVVAKGETVSTVGRQLRRQGFIRSSSVFRLYVQVMGAERKLQAGTYNLPAQGGIPAIVRRLQAGAVAHAEVTLTIPEGFTVTQIADLLQSHGVCAKTSFLQEEEKGVFTEPVIAGLPQRRNVHLRLEGYLFPDTYHFAKGESAHSVLDTMLENFQTHVESVGPYGGLKGKGMSLNEWVTIASLVEREARVQSEGPLIAGVICNRLTHRPAMRLQVDATVEYILGHRDTLYKSDLQVKDAYNTYLHDGLPPGPISNPGMSSLLAALHPQHSPYLYYVVKNNGSGEHYFAATYTEQLHNERVSRQNLKGGRL